MISKIWFEITEMLFGKELDKAFMMGVEEGRKRQAAQIRVEMDYKKSRAQETGLTKTQAIGWERCMEVVQDVIK